MIALNRKSKIHRCMSVFHCCIINVGNELLTLVDDREEVGCHEWLIITPSKLPNDLNISQLTEDYISLSADEIKKLLVEYKKDQNAISQMVKQNRLDMFFNLCSSIISEQLIQTDVEMIE
jgi:hypothetical protein